jgi:hypothetical protein
MLFKGTIIAAASGSMGGLTFSRGKGGPYIRTRANPIHPGSVYQEAIKAAFSQLSVAWQDQLTPAQRAGWDAYADQVSLVNRMGDPIFVTGANMFIRSNTGRLQAGGPRVDNAPVIYTLGEFTAPSYAVTAASNDVMVTHESLDAWANEDDGLLLIFASVPKSPTINYHNGPYRLIGTILGNSVTPPPNPANFALTAPIALGQRTFFAATASRADGRYSYRTRNQTDAV